ncbi:MAG: alpha/beta hydrolase [Sorangium cellulosum]|nr:MAG: alpha/beta hydrolase [Sorangium cellulosum]
MRPPEMEMKRTRSFDGSEIVYQVAGTQGPWIVLANGLGANTTAWRHQIAYLSDKHRFLTWEYRGLYAHEEEEQENSPLAGAPVDVHAQDMAAVLNAESVKGGVWMGWSLGAQVLLETFHRNNARPELIVLINPCYGRNPSDVSRLRKLWPHALWAFEQVPEVIERMVRRMLSWPETVTWLKRLGFVSSAIDEEALGELVKHFRSVRGVAYLDALRVASSHRVDGILGAVDVPTLAIVGQKDAVTPRPIAEPMARQIPGAELFLIRGATHFALLEYPELINLRIEKFLREHNM